VLEQYQKMPPFSQEDLQAKSHHHGGLVVSMTAGTGRLTEEEKAFLRRISIEKQGEEEVSSGVSDLWSKLSATTTTITKQQQYDYLLEDEGKEGEEDNTQRAPNEFDVREPDEIDHNPINISSTKLSYSNERNRNPIIHQSRWRYSLATASQKSTNKSRKSRTRPTRRLSRRLSTIPEKHVTFGIPVTYLIPSRKQYDSETKKILWYSSSDRTEMRKSCIRAAKTVTKDSYSELYCPLHFRGLEYLIEEQQYIQAMEQKKNIDDNATDKVVPVIHLLCSRQESENEPPSTRITRSLDGLDAVLQEQENQRLWVQQYYSHRSYGSIIDPEAIRSVYTTKGKTQTSHWIAHLYALRDEEIVREMMSEEMDVSTQNPYDDDDCNEASCGIKTNELDVFQKLLTPFLDIRHGDVYIQMGEECVQAFS